MLDLCAGPGIKTGQIAARMGDRGEVIAVEQDPGRAAEVAEQARRLGLRSVTVVEADAAATGWPPASTGSWSIRPAPTSARWPRARTPAGASRRGRSSASPSCRAQILLRGLEALRPGGTLVYSTCTISRREGEEQIAALLAQAAAGEAPLLSVDDLGALAPDLASPHDRRCLQLRPDRDSTTGFFVCRLRKDD